MASRTKVAPEQPDTTTDADVRVDPRDAEPAVRITTRKDRPRVEIDEKFYDLKVMGDFGIARQQALSRDGREFAQLWHSEVELTEDQGKRLKQLLERMFEDLLVAPKTVMRQLDDAAKADVVLTFTLAPVQKAMAKMLEEQARQLAEQAQTENVEPGDSASISTS